MTLIVSIDVLVDHEGCLKIRCGRIGDITIEKLQKHHDLFVFACTRYDTYVHMYSISKALFPFPI